MRPLAASAWAPASDRGCRKADDNAVAIRCYHVVQLCHPRVAGRVRPRPVLLRPVTAQARSALALLVPRVVADHHHATVPANHLALVANPLDARLNLHRATF